MTENNFGPLPVTKSIVVHDPFFEVLFDEPLSAEARKAVACATIDALDTEEPFAMLADRLRVGRHDDIVLSCALLRKLQEAFSPQIPHTAWAEYEQITTDLIKVEMVLVDPTIYEDGRAEHIASQLRDSVQAVHVTLRDTKMELVLKGELRREADRLDMLNLLESVGIGVAPPRPNVSIAFLI